MSNFFSNNFGENTVFGEVFPVHNTGKGISSMASGARGVYKVPIEVGRGAIDVARATGTAAQGVWEAGKGLRWAVSEISGAVSGIRDFSMPRYRRVAAHMRDVAGDRFYTSGLKTGFMWRSPAQHLKAGGVRLTQSLLPTNAVGRAVWVGTAGFAMMGTEENDMFSSSENGLAKNFIGGAANAIGWEVGGSMGAAAGVAMGGPIGAAVGYVAGALGAGYLAEKATDIPWKLASMTRERRGRVGRHARSMLSSERAVTQRQRALQMVYSSGSGPRSALGNEALSYHC